MARRSSPAVDRQRRALRLGQRQRHPADETADLRITDPSGNTVSSITVQKGQTYTFQITNTAGFAHDFYIGSPDDLKAANTANLKGLDQFTSGTQSFSYTFDSAGPLGFGCTLPGHYQSMNGLFVIQ